MSPQYLFCSVHTENNKPGGSRTFNPFKKETVTLFLEEDDSFKDALPDFMSISDQSFYSQIPGSIYDLSCHDVCEQCAGACYADASNHDMEVKGKVGEVFYEAADSNVPDFVSVTFLTRSPGSPQYDGIDTQVETHYL